jgi:hypothetical protein
MVIEPVPLMLSVLMTPPTIGPYVTVCDDEKAQQRVDSAVAGCARRR